MNQQDINKTLDTTFPIYNRLDKQARFHPGYKGEIAPLLAPNNHLLPFQFRRTIRSASYAIATWNGDAVFKAIDIHTGEQVNLLDWFTSRYIMKQFDDIGFQYIIFRGGDLLENELDKGYYYLQISDGMDTWYSEVFKVDCVSESEGGVRVSSSEDQRIYSTDNKRIYN